MNFVNLHFIFVNTQHRHVPKRLWGPFTNTLWMRKNPPFSKSLKLQEKNLELIKL